MSEKHDVTKSSNPDVQALLQVNKLLANSILLLRDEVAAIRAELANLPQSFVVPGPEGEVPQVYNRSGDVRLKFDGNNTVFAGGGLLADLPPLASTSSEGGDQVEERPTADEVADLPGT